MIVLIALALFLIIVTLIWIRGQYQLKCTEQMDLSEKHIMITGGSSGIGKELAIAIAKRGANVSIFARNLEKLKEAKCEIEAYVRGKSGQRILIFSVDLGSSYESVDQTFAQACTVLGSPSMLFNCVGVSYPSRFEDTPIDNFQKSISINLMSAIYATRSCIAAMKEQKSGHIVFVSSVAGLVGLYGFCSYSAPKFALRGFAESLSMEMKPYNISVTVAYPPDTDTPGFAEENKLKPLETHLICDEAGLFSAETVANRILADTLVGKFSSYVGLDSWMVHTACAGMSAGYTAFELVTQVFLMGPIRFVLAFYLLKFDRIVKKCASDRDLKEQGS